jgi:hypothetical protein
MPPDPQTPFSDTFASMDDTTAPDGSDPTASADDDSRSDDSGDDTPPTGGDIVDAARKYSGSLGYKLYNYNNQTPSGVPKDNHFIADALDDSGVGFGDDPRDRPSIADWADPSSAIPGFAPVSDGSVQAGDVLATAKPIPKNWYTGKGQYLGIATGDGTSLGIVDNDRIGENQFGLLPGHDPVVWRSTQLADADPADTNQNMRYGSGQSQPTLLGAAPTDGSGMQQLAGASDEQGKGDQLPPGGSLDCPPLVNQGGRQHPRDGKGDGPWNGEDGNGQMLHCVERWPFPRWEPGIATAPPPYGKK